MLPQPLSPRQAHAEAAQPQTQQPARPGHSEVPAARPLLASRRVAGGHPGGARGRAEQGLNAKRGGARAPGARTARERDSRKPHFVRRRRVAGRQVGASLAAARFSQARGAAGALFPLALRELKSRRVWPRVISGSASTRTPRFIFGHTRRKRGAGDPD